MLLADLVATSSRVGATRSRLEKIGHLTELLRRLAPDEVELGAAYLAGEIPGGRLGVGPALLRDARPGTAAAKPSLELREVQQALRRVAETGGAGSKGERARLLFELFARGTADEQRFLFGLLMGEVRHGALEGIVLEAIARAADVPAGEVRRAAMLAGDVPLVARVASTEGAAGLGRFRMELFRPLQPMLAQPADDVDDALARLERAGLEYKLDGARVQVHKSGDDVRVFTRRLNDVTAAVPEVVEACRALSARELVLDGEALALRPDGSPQPFQVTMRRFGRKLDVERMRGELPLDVFFFDALYRDGEELIDRPAEERFASLADALPARLVVPRIVTAAVEEAAAFLAQALDRGHEGVMAKSLGAAYEAGGRGRSWLKVKPAHTLDLVVLAAEWGSGRRKGWLSNLHLGARVPDASPSAGGADGFVMLGKTFKGLTDELLAWQTQELLARETGREGHVVHVRPELVVEIAANELQASPKYPGGLALRFARVKRYRPDKEAAEADTIETVRAIHEGRIRP